MGASGIRSAALSSSLSNSLVEGGLVNFIICTGKFHPRSGGEMTQEDDEITTMEHCDKSINVKYCHCPVMTGAEINLKINNYRLQPEEVGDLCRWNMVVFGDKLYHFLETSTSLQDIALVLLIEVPGGQESTQNF